MPVALILCVRVNGQHINVVFQWDSQIKHQEPLLIFSQERSHILVCTQQSFCQKRKIDIFHDSIAKFYNM